MIEYIFRMGISPVVAGNYTMEMPSDNVVAHPMYGNDLTKEYAPDGDRFTFRGKMKGSLTFVGPDFERIISMAHDDIMLVNVGQVNGEEVDLYHKGFFTKTDCEFDYDNRRVTVELSTVDDYTKIIDGLNKEYDLVQLAPEITHVSITKRPLLQIYALGDTMVTCLQGISSWEVDAAVTSTDLDIKGYGFTRCGSIRFVSVSGVSVTADGLYFGRVFRSFTTAGLPTRILGPLYKKDSNLRLQYDYEYLRGYYFPHIFLYDGSTIVASFDSSVTGYESELATFNFGSGRATVKQQEFYSRLLTDAEEVNGVSTETVPSEDIVSESGYSRMMPLAIAETSINVSHTFSVAPTEWGIDSEGDYFEKPDVFGKVHPLARSLWSYTSFWLTSAPEWDEADAGGRVNYTLRHSYPLYSVIQRLLEKVAPDITFERNGEHSEFLYGQGGQIKTDAWELFLTPKTNIVNGDYSTPARRAPITLQEVFDMLKSVYQVYWFIENGRLRLEHVEYFRRGKTYKDEGVVVVDLISAVNPRSGKSWADGQSVITYDRENMPERYEFKWMDEATEKFVGQPIEILSPAVERGNVESVTIAKFSSDIDYIMMHPSAISPEGFVLLAAESGALPIIEVDGAELQNGYASLAYVIPKYWVYDLPNKRVRINGEEMELTRSKKSAKQSVSFPWPDDIDPLLLVRTHIGDGQVEEYSVNITNRTIEATLSYEG